jgi:hypothetical protein
MQGKDTIYVLYLTGKKCQLITDHHQAYSREDSVDFGKELGGGWYSGLAGFCSSCERGHACCQNSLHGSRPKDSDTRWSDSKACMHVSVLQGGGGSSTVNPITFFNLSWQPNQPDKSYFPKVSLQSPPILYSLQDEPKLQYMACHGL